MNNKKKWISFPLKVFRFIWKTVRILLIGYAVLFSFAMSALIIAGFLFVSKPLNEVKALKTENPRETAYMNQYRKELLSEGNSDSLYQKFVPLDSVSPLLIQAVLAAEDDGFYTHPGFDLNAIIDAIDHNRSVNANRRGASTITQQTAKNFFLYHDRTFERKLKELGYTLLMEKYLGKERILELYLNYAQWGKNIFGCEAASRHYFNKPSHRLNRFESARMAAVLAMPSRITPHHTKSVFMARRLAVIANNLYLRGHIDVPEYYQLTGNYPPGLEEIPEEPQSGEEEFNNDR